MSFVDIPRLFSEEATVTVIGGGSSLAGFPFERLQSPTIGVNVAGLLLGTDVCFSLDHRFPQEHLPGIREYLSVGGELWLAQSPSRHEYPIEEARYLQRRRGVFATNTYEVFGSSSGFGALNFAVTAGARKIVLLGIDMTVSEESLSHWHDEYPAVEPQGLFTRWAREFEQAAPHLAEKSVEVTNVVGVPKSALTCFPTMSIDEFLGTLPS